MGFSLTGLGLLVLFLTIKLFSLVSIGQHEYV